MRLVSRLTIAVLCFGLSALAGAAQQPRDRPAARDGQANARAVDSIVNRMMAFDKNKDGKLSRDEITDQRLLRLFDRADADKDGVVTKEELIALAKRMVQEEGANSSRRPGFGPPGGRGGFGPPTGGPPQPGQVMPPFLQDMLKLTADQKKQLAELQKEVDSKLGKILTAEQKKRLQEMRRGFGRGGPGGPPRPPARP